MRSLDEVTGFLARVIEDVTVGAVPATSVSVDTAIQGDLGLDSLDFATVMLAAEEWLGVALDESAVDWASVRTVGQLAALLHGCQGAADS